MAHKLFLPNEVAVEEASLINSYSWFNYRTQITLRKKRTHIPQELFDSLVQSMPERYQTVLIWMPRSISSWTPLALQMAIFQLIEDVNKIQTPLGIRLQLKKKLWIGTWIILIMISYILIKVCTQFVLTSKDAQT